MMRFLGSLLLALLILGVILGAVGFFAVRNIDPNMFRTEFERYLTQQTGFRVELGEISFQWGPQPQVQVASLNFYQPQTLEKLLQSEHVRIDADLTALLRKQFNLSKVVIQSPQIFLKRDIRGAWNWEVAKQPAPAALSPKGPNPGGGLIPVAEVSEAQSGISLAGLKDLGEGWKFGIGKVQIREGEIHFEDATVQPAYKLDIRNLDAEVLEKESGKIFHFTAAANIFDAAKRNLEAEGNLDIASRSLELSLRYGPEKVLFKGLLKIVNHLPRFEGSLEVRDLDIESVTPAVYKSKEYLTGQLRAGMQVSLEGANPDSIKRSLKGQGTVEIKNGALKNRNLVKEVFDRLTPVLAVTTALGGEMPPELAEMLKERDTPFQSLRAAFNAQGGSAKLTGFQLIHPNYQLSGAGTYGLLDERVDGSMELLLSKNISAYLMKKIREMELLADRNGQVMIPFRYSGVLPDAAVQPDIPYVTSRLMQKGAEQLLNRGLEELSKYLERKRK